MRRTRRFRRRLQPRNSNKFTNSDNALVVSYNGSFYLTNVTLPFDIPLPHDIEKIGDCISRVSDTTFQLDVGYYRISCYIQNLVWGSQALTDFIYFAIYDHESDIYLDPGMTMIPQWYLIGKSSSFMDIVIKFNLPSTVSVRVPDISGVVDAIVSPRLTIQKLNI